MQVAYVSVLALALCSSTAVAQCETASFTPPGNETDFGASVAILDGVAAVGAPTSGPDGAGLVHVFSKDALGLGTGWGLQATLTPSDGSTGFGCAVTTWSRCIAVGTDAACVFVFEDQQGTWVERQKITPSAPATSEFGSAVYMHKEKLIVGAPDASGVTSGSAHLFELVDATWVPTEVLQPADLQPGDDFGRSVATYHRVLVGAPGHDSALGPDTGASYLYENLGSGWVQTDKLTAFDAAAHDRFGQSVSLLDNSILIGAPASLPSGAGNGAAYLYRRNESQDYVLENLLLGWDDTPGTEFGSKVYVTERSAIVSAPLAQTAGGITGAAYLWQNTLAGWNQAGKLSETNPSAGSGFSASASLWSDWLIVGAPDGGPSDAGSATIFFTGQPVLTYCVAKLSSQGCTPQIGASGLPSFDDPTPCLVTATQVLNNKSGLFFYGTSGMAEIPFFGGTLCVMPPLQRTSIQLSGGNPPPDDCSGSFTFDFNALAQSGFDPALMPGIHIQAQFWSRDPLHPDGTGIGLTDAIELTACP